MQTVFQPILITATACLFGVFNASWAETPSAPTNKPNLIFILADDLGWSDTTLYGTASYHQTPNVERLAARGMTFSRAYSASPLCSPTRSAILTGLSPARTGITTPNCHLPQVVLQATVGKSAAANQMTIQPETVTRLKPEYRTMAEAFKDAGYATGHFGKWHLGAEPYSPLQQGFDVDLPHHHGPGPAGSYVAPWKFPNFKEREPAEHIEDRMASEAIAWMKENRDRPFFLNYWMFSVHAPFDAKKQAIEKHSKSLSAAGSKQSPTYAAMIESMDQAVGRLLDAVDELGISENTIIVFTSDNGGNMYSEIDGTVPTSNRPLRGGKASMFEGGTRVPCIVSWPGITHAASRSEAMVQSEDFFPTLIEGLGLPKSAEQTFDGYSFLPALRQQPYQREAAIQFFPHNPQVPDWLPPSVSVHDGDLKLIRIFNGSGAGKHRYKLFNLRDDIGESNDLANAMPERVQQLDAKIEKFLERTSAVTPAPNPAFDPLKYDLAEEGKSKPKPAKSSKQPASKQPDSGASGDNPDMLGWKTRQCSAEVLDGVALIHRTGKEPFLGFAAGKLDADAKLRFRLRCNGGEGKVAWLPSASASSDETPKPKEFVVKAGAWVEVSVDIYAPSGKGGIVRLFLPNQEEPVELDWIELETKVTKKRWDF